MPARAPIRRLLTAGSWIAFLVMVVVSGSPSRADGATASTTVGATVLSAVSLDESGCRASSDLDLGTLTINSWSIGTPCTVTFGSSNDQSRLLVSQRDQTGSAMESIGATWTPIGGSTFWYAGAVGSGGKAWAGGLGGPGEPATRFEYTADGGATWTNQTSCDGSYPIDLQALSDTLLYAVTNSHICRTTVGGIGAGAWTTVATGSFQRIWMVNSTLGYAAGVNGKVYKTTDGVTFTEIYDDPWFDTAPAINATAGGTVILAGRRTDPVTSEYGVLVSTDAGATFTRQILKTNPGPDTGGVYGTLAVNDSILLASSPYGAFRSTDSGTTWSAIGSGSWAGTAFRRSDGVIFAQTGGDSIVRSANDGATWTTMQLGTNVSAHIRVIAGSGLSDMWVFGYADRRLRTTDAGVTWTSTSPTKSSYAAVTAWPGGTWVVAGSGGVVMRTTDDGATLTPLTLGTTRAFNAGVTLSSTTALLVGDQVVYRTTDKGATWQPVTVPAPVTTWYEVARDEDGKAWAVGSGGRVMSSVDDGATWTAETSVPGAPPLYGMGVWRGTIWVGSDTGRVWSSSTAGALTWTAAASTGRAGVVFGIWAVDATTAVVATTFEAGANSSFVSRTTDGGATWTSTATAPTITHMRELTTDPGHKVGYLTTSSVYVTSNNGGSSWSSTGTGVGVSGYVGRIEPLNGGRMIAVGDAGLIAKAVPRAPVPDGMGGGGSGFGACLETQVGATTASWVLAGSGNCVAAQLGNWQSIAVDQGAPTATVASRSTPGNATVDLRFGLRTGNNQSAGSYAAVLAFETLAP